jgi:hypothetical protein
MLGQDEIRESEDRLFQRWRDHWNKNDRVFLPDGAMPDFAAQPFRLVFALKEGNDPDGSWVIEDKGDLREAWSWGFAQVNTWQQLARWADFILRGGTAKQSTALSTEATTAVLKKIACFNLKKQPGGSAEKYGQVRKAAKEDALFIKEQISLYQPHLIVCCGTFSILEEIFDISADRRYSYKDMITGDDMNFFNGPALCRVMDFWHPQQRKKTTEYLHGRLVNNLNYLRAGNIP